MENHSKTSGALAEEITKASSKQTYYTFLLFVDRPFLKDAFRGYAYFRWVDDILDADGGSKLEKIRFLKRQTTLLRNCFQGNYPACLCPEEEMLADLVRNNSPTNPGLKSYLFNMMAVMEFDVKRRHSLISRAELTEYSRLLAVAVTDFMHYFMGHNDPAPTHSGRYLAVTAAHLTHMLRDAHEDVQVGYFNIPQEFLAANGLEPGEIDNEVYRKWVCQSVKQARQYFAVGREYLSQVSNWRCRLAGFAYTARFEWMLRTIERENYCLRADYSDRKSFRASIWIILTALLSVFRPTSSHTTQSTFIQKPFG